jgi:type II secretory pathway pseudopilin PulG
MHSRGFTLIEMTIAIGLGLLIVLVSFSGIRVASQTITIANRLSLQNDILRTAVVKANEEMDFWDAFDSRSDPEKQPLRNGDYPFKSLDFTGATTVLDFNPKLTADRYTTDRLWWNGHLWSSNRLSDGTNYQRRFGDYSLFGRQGLTAADYGTLVTSLYPTVVDERKWRHNILPYLTSNLGYYAAFDYLPANFVYGCYDTTGDMPIEFGAPGVGPGRMRNSWHSGNKPQSKIEAGHDNGYILTNVSPTSNYPHTHQVSHRASYNDGSSAGFTDTKYPDRFDAFPEVEFSANIPTNWPSTKMKVKVTYQWMDFRHQVRIEQTDPLTGATTAMVLHGLTTTLRGARRQRGLDTEPRDDRYP